jgi:transposase
LTNSKTIKVPSALLQCVTKQSRLRTAQLTPNDNKSFSIGTVLMVDDWYERLELNEIIGQLKTKGIDADALVRGMLADQLGDNFSILQASEWMNRPEILEHYEIDPFVPKTLYRTVEMVGQNRGRIIYALQDRVLKLLGGPKTDILLDWTSIVYYGDMAKLAKYGFSRDHRPDERQFTLGAAQLAPPYDIPIGLTIEAGNINDQTHMWRTYGQVRPFLQERSLVVFDRGANDKTNLDRIGLDKNDYLTAKKLNSSDDAIFGSFSKTAWECIDADAGVYAIKKAFPSRVNYYIFSEKLKKDHLRSRRRKAERLLAEARAIQDSLDKGKKLPKRFRINNPLVDVKYDYQTKLVAMDEEAALRLLLEDVIDGREGCFCLTSSRDMPASEALKIYRSKDAIEKLFHSLKSEIEIKPVRVWTEDAVYGVLLIGFIAQLMISLTRHFVKPVKRMSTKFIIASLQNLTETVVSMGNGLKKRFFSNFDEVNKAILAEYLCST